MRSVDGFFVYVYNLICGVVGFDEMSLDSFVAEVFGVECLQRLKYIHRGGRNNAKGNQYEQYYLLFKIFQLASQNGLDFDLHELQSQSYAFVDDICYIDRQNNVKHNYQLKNSHGESALWSLDIEERFFYQQKIDIDFLKFNKSKNYFIVSDLSKVSKNRQRIQNIVDEHDFECEYFPYFERLVDLLSYPPFVFYIDSLIMPNATVADKDYAVRLILNAIEMDRGQSIVDIFQRAESDAFPNPFVKFRKKTGKILPTWLQFILDSFQPRVDYSVQYDTLNVIFNHCLTLSVHLDVILAQEPKQISSIQTLQQFLIDCSMQELSGSMV